MNKLRIFYVVSFITILACTKKDSLSVFNPEIHTSNVIYNFQKNDTLYLRPEIIDYRSNDKLEYIQLSLTLSRSNNIHREVIYIILPKDSLQGLHTEFVNSPEFYTNGPFSHVFYSTYELDIVSEQYELVHDGTTEHSVVIDEVFPNGEVTGSFDLTFARDTTYECLTCEVRPDTFRVHGFDIRAFRPAG